MSAPQDPNKIDVSLSIMSDATLAAVNNLTTQLAGLRAFLSSQNPANPAAQAQAAGGWSQVPGGGFAWTGPSGEQAGIHHGPSSPVVAGDPSNPSQGAQTSRQRAQELADEAERYQSFVRDRSRGSQGPVPYLSPEAEQQMAHRMGDIQRFKLARQEKKAGVTRSAMDRFFQLYPGTQRDPYESRSYEFEAGIPQSGGSALPEGVSGIPAPGGVSGGGSYPPQGPPPTATGGASPGGDMPGWWNALNREGINPESRLGLTIPRLGEFTIQDKLNMAAQWMGRAAQRRGQYDPTTGETTFGPFASRMGTAAAGAAYLRDQSASMVAIGREFQRVRGFARGEEQNAEALGFSRESSLGDAELFGIGFRTNLGFTSAAQREALHQEWTQRRVQAAAGVSGEEAQRIRQTVAGMGYSGETNERLQLDLFRHLQARGIAPEPVAPLVDQGIRQGNMSILSLRDTIVELARAARNANMTLEDATQSAAEYAESVQNIGANYEQALRNAATFTRSGLDPRIASQAMQSPMMQGILTAQTGLPPNLQGVLPASGVMRAMGTAIQQGLAFGSPYLNMPDRVTRSVGGQEIDRVTGKDIQIAMAAQTSGVPRQIVERYMRNPQFLETGATAQAMVGKMQQEVEGLTHRRITETITDKERMADAQGVARFGRHIDPDHSEGSIRRRVQKDISVDLTDAQRRMLEHGSNADKVVQYNELEQQMLAMDPNNKDWRARVRKIRTDHGDINARLQTAARIVGEAVNAKPEPDYLVGLTPEAAKALKIEKPKDRTGALPRANSGGAPANQSFTGPNFPGSTSGAFSYGTPGP